MTEGTFANESPEGLSPDPTVYATGADTTYPGKRAVLAGIGAVATACDVANSTFDRFVDRGSEAQEDVRRRLDEARLQNAGRRNRFSDVVRSAMNTLLDGVNVPNKADVDIINAKLNIVTRKLDDLQLQAVQSATSSTTPSVEVVPPAVGTPDTTIE